MEMEEEVEWRGGRKTKKPKNGRRNYANCLMGGSDEDRVRDLRESSRLIHFSLKSNVIALPLLTFCFTSLLHK